MTPLTLKSIFCRESDDDGRADNINRVEEQFALLFDKVLPEADVLIKRFQSVDKGQK